MAQDASNNVINNYKGVMLCSRPNEKKAIATEKPFCARVVPGVQLGINPVKQQHGVEPQSQNKKGGVLSKHKQWLSQFKGNVQKTKMEIEEKSKKDDEKFKRIKEQAEADRQRAKKMKEEYQQAATQVLNVLDDKVAPSRPTGQLTFDNLRKLDADNQSEKKPKQLKKGEEFKKKGAEKPVWAMTKQAAEQTEDKEMNELLDFFQQTDMNDFSQDAEIKNLLANLQEKIQNMKKEENWKQKQAERLQKAKQSGEDGAAEQDKYSQFSGGRSEGKSVASEKSQKKMEELRAKMKQQKEWDKQTASEKSSAANLQDRIAKNLADEVLRNYPGMRGVHSNTSIRKLLEAQAAKVMNQPIMRPVITTVIRQKNPLNANTLPYLHRNPAI